MSGNVSRKILPKFKVAYAMFSVKLNVHLCD